MIKEIYKLCLGCGPTPKKGFINMDALPWDGADIDVIHNATERPYPFADCYFQEVHAIEFLEHISFRQMNIVINEVYRILEVGGKFHVQVPDCGKMMEYYMKGLVCDCVENKPKTEAGGKADKWCVKCSGKAKVHQIRWLLSFCGAQKHEMDYHRNIFTKERIKEVFNPSMWKLKFIKDPRGWKLKFNAIKK